MLFMTSAPPSRYPRGTLTNSVSSFMAVAGGFIPILEKSLLVGFCNKSSMGP